MIKEKMADITECKEHLSRIQYHGTFFVYGERAYVYIRKDLLLISSEI